MEKSRALNEAGDGPNLGSLAERAWVLADQWDAGEGPAPTGWWEQEYMSDGLEKGWFLLPVLMRLRMVGLHPDLGSAVCMGCNNLERGQWGVGLGSVAGDVWWKVGLPQHGQEALGGPSK